MSVWVLLAHISLENGRVRYILKCNAYSFRPCDRLFWGMCCLCWLIRDPNRLVLFELVMIKHLSAFFNRNYLNRKNTRHVFFFIECVNKINLILQIEYLVVNIGSESSVRPSTGPVMELLPEEIVNAKLNAAPHSVTTTHYYTPTHQQSFV